MKNKIFVIMIVMILLIANISFGKDTESDIYNPKHPYYYSDNSDKYHSEKPD
ncbi:unnamed protein product, partial [marine sediment metagenome]